MLDIKYIRENAKEIKEAIKNKNIILDLDHFLDLNEKRIKLLQYVEELNGEKNKLNELMKSAKDKERDDLIEMGKKAKQKILKITPELKEMEEEFQGLMVKMPVVPSKDTPVGKSEEENKEIHQWGEKPKADFKLKTHIELGKDLDIIDFNRGVKVGGYRGYYLKNEGVLLVMAIMNYALAKMIEKGFFPMIPPTLVKEFALFGSGYFKGREYDGSVDEIYQVATSDKEAGGEISRDKKFLVGTAEPSLLAYYSGETLEEKQLPIKLCGFSQCYRSEIGSYGKDTKGMYRVHEFMKVEQVILGRADIAEAEKMQDEMVGISKEMHEELGLPYRQIIICTGDLSAGKYRQYDLEAWLPGMNRWGETGSASIFLDWQSRRLNVKYTDKDGKKKYVYMLNNTALATPRTLIAILENFQKADGSVEIPKVLRKWMPGGMERIKYKYKK